MTSILKSQPAITLISAKPRSGKTQFIKYMICTLFMERKIKYGLVFCPTLFNGSYNFIPEQFTYSMYDERIIKNLMRLQVRQIIEKGKDNVEPAFIVLDDCIGSINFDSPLFQKLISRYRHYNITIFIATQYLFKIPPLIRDCTTYFICFNQTTKKSIDAIHETFMQDFNYKTCYQFIKKNTKDYHFIVVDNEEAEENKYTVSKVPLLENASIYY